MVLSNETYSLSVREYDLECLEILPIERFWGSCIFGLALVGIVDTKGSELNPFFIEKEKASKLQQLLALKPRPLRL
jgi:hypothetical protein